MKKRTFWMTLLVLGGVLGVFITLLGGGVPTAAAPPLSLDGLRDEKLPEAPHDSASLNGINENCFVCHGNYRTEKLVLSHGKGKVGCIKCHGESLPHQRSEDHRIPPEKMYSREGVDSMCRACHEEHNVPAAKVLARWRERCSPDLNPKETVCTDCHFDHRLPLRKVVWNRKTRQIVSQEQTNTPAKPRPVVDRGL